ncbi:MAG: O-antigen ligase family protein [Anaerolineae bacterium]
MAFAAGMMLIAVLRYRRFIPFIVFGGLLLLLLPQTQAYIDRFMQGFAGQDLATQMRIGEYTDSFRLISRYPIFGVGFTGTPENDIYTNAASLYLIMANQIGLVGVAIFLTTMGGVFVYGLITFRRARVNPELDSIHLGYHIAVLTALVNGAADLYFFRIDFQASILLFWSTVGLALASSRLVESTVD